MSRIKLLQSSEIKIFDAPPIFNNDHRLQFFGINEFTETKLRKFRTPYSKLGFILQLGYFKCVGRFFEIGNFHKEDIDYVIENMRSSLTFTEFHTCYTKQTAYYHREHILDLCKWRPFDEVVFRHQIKRLVERQLMPRKVLFEIQSFLYRTRMEAPAYDKYLKSINQALLEVGRDISRLLEQQLNGDHKEILDGFLEKPQSHLNANLIQYRTINQSTGPKDIEKSLEQFKTLKSKLESLKVPVQALGLSDAVIDYHAYWASIAKVDKIQDHSDRYLFLICFLIHQVRKRHDFFIDILLQNVKLAHNFTKRQQKENYFQNHKQRTAATRLLIETRINYHKQLEKVKTIISSPINDSQKVIAIQELLEVEIALESEQLQKIALLEKEMNNDPEDQYYLLWEKRSKWLSNRVGAILRNMVFSQHSDKGLLSAVELYTIKNGRINAPAKDITWLDNLQQDLLYTLGENGKEKFRPGLYKMFLFTAVENGIKSGIINFQHSYRYRFLEEYLIDKNEWILNRESLLEDAGLALFTECKTVIEGLKIHLEELYHETNENMKAGKNEYFTFNRKRKPIITTPPVEKPDTEKVSAYFRPVRYISILSLLSEVEKAAPFLHFFGHQSKTDEKKRPKPETFFGAILALGCNIGIDRMGRISKGVQLTNLKHTADWYLTEQALQDANDTIISVKNSLNLPQVHRKDPEQMHTASDGQKILIKKDSLNATYSTKYPGFNKASSINTAIDERFATYYSAVITAADREAGNVPDMHLGNPVIKSTIHSTDTHGGTEVIFGIMHFLEIFFAPRIKDLGTLDLYSFLPRRYYQDLGYDLLPDHYINEKLIEDNWDEMLRLVASLKLGKTTAFQVLKRMNSYAKQNPLQKAFKEFGRIIRSSFILRYYDDLELRQSVEKQLSHIEMMNRFAKSVFFGNNQEFTVATKPEQEKGILCRRFIQNAIVLWNYLYLSELLTKVESEEAMEDMIAIIRNGTAVAWQHINMLGEYDFDKMITNEKLRFDLKKIFEWKHKA
jgi:TnpA family transposase